MTWLLISALLLFALFFYWDFIYFHAKISPIIHKNRRTFSSPIDTHLLLLESHCCWFFIYLFKQPANTKKSWKLLLFYLFVFDISLLFFLAGLLCIFRLLTVSLVCVSVCVRFFYWRFIMCQITFVFTIWWFYITPFTHLTSEPPIWFICFTSRLAQALCLTYPVPYTFVAAVVAVVVACSVCAFPFFLLWRLH